MHASRSASGPESATVCRPRVPRSKVNDLAGVHDVGGSSARLMARITASAGRRARPRDTSSCPGRRRARRCRCRPWRWRARPGVDERLGARDFVGVVHVDRMRQVEIAVADMADDRRERAGFGDVALRLDDAFGEPRDRHADVGGERSRAGPQRLARPVGVVARLPQPGAILRLASPSRTAPPPNSRRSRRSAPTARRRPPRCRGTREQHRRLGQVELGIDVDGPHLQRVEQFDARHRDAGLDRQDDRVAGRLDRRKRTDAGGDRLRNAVRAAASAR